MFTELIESEPFDLVIGDEAWEVDHFLHENPELKRFRFAWLTDFVGWLPMPDADDRERALTADYNAEMLEHRSRFRDVRDRSVFVGNPDDVVPDPFGPGLPPINTWVRENFAFSGYVTGAPTVQVADPASLRARWGCVDGDLLCVVTVGGSGVGGALLRRVLDGGAGHDRPGTPPAVPGRHRSTDRPGVFAAQPIASRSLAICPTCTGTWRRAMSPSCRAA